MILSDTQIPGGKADDWLSRTLGGALEALAGEEPAPGGGSAAALAGSMAAGLVGMVAHLTLKRRRLAEVHPEFETILAEVDVLRSNLLDLAGRDAAAYLDVAAAYRLPRGEGHGEAAQADRDERIQAALMNAAGVPLKTCRRCVRLLELALDACRRGNPNAVTDAGVAALLAAAGFRGAGYNVRINLKDITDAEFVAHTAAELEHLTQRAAELERETSEAVGARLQS